MATPKLELRASFQRECLLRVNRAAGSVLLVTAAVLLGFFAMHAVQWSGPERTYSLVYLALEILVILGLVTLTRRGDRSDCWGHLACLLAILCVTGVASVHRLAYLEPNYERILNLVLLCGGVVMLDGSWYGLAVLVVLGQRALLSRLVDLADTSQGTLELSVAVVAVGCGCLYLRRSGFYRQFSLMREERSGQDALRAALTEAEALRQELDQRVRQRAAELVMTRGGVEQSESQQDQLRLRIEALQRGDPPGRLAGSVAHHLSGQLSTARQALERLLQTELSPSERQALQSAREAVLEVGELAQQMLAFSGNQPLNLKPVSLEELVSSTRPLLEGFLGDGIRFEAHVRCGDARVLGDRWQLQQVLVHLALDAREAMQGVGSLSLRADRAEDRLVLSISDTRPNLGPDEIEHLFQPFALETSEGLGLAVVEGIVSQHGGSLWAQSAPDQGLTFFVTLPLELA